MTLRTTLAALSLAAACWLAPLAPAWAGPGEDGPQIDQAQATRDVDLVICLDTSGSMSGLLDACRQKLWDICSLVAQARPEPRLRVSLLSYGGNDNPDGGFVVVRQGFTEELDLVYEQLMALEATGGTELVGRVIHESLDQLQWSDGGDALKLLFVAGNESADQDSQHPFRQQCQRALQENVVVNAIFCGAETDGDAAGWRELAQFGGGEFANIDKDNGTINVATPYDEALNRLSAELNTTYLPFGARGRTAYANQQTQDENARGQSSSAAASRAACKAGGAYRNTGWDLVDAWQTEDFDWTQLETEDLPESLQSLNQAEREAHLKSLLQRRQTLQTQVQALNAERQDFIRKALAERNADASLDFAMAKAIRAQAEASGFRFD